MGHTSHTGEGGRPDPEIADELHLPVNTVKTHLKSIYRKLAVSRRGEAVRRARELGLLCGLFTCPG